MAKNIVLGILLISYVLLLTSVRIQNTQDLYVILSFFLIYILSIRIIWIDNRPYSLNLFFGLFNLFFFAIAPTYQYKEKIYPWISFDYKDSQIIETNILIIIALLIYSFTYHFLVQKRAKNIYLLEKPINYNINLRRNGYIISFIGFLICCLVLIFIYDAKPTQFRPSLVADPSEIGETTSSMLLKGITLRGYVLGFLILSTYFYRTKQINLFLFSLICALSIYTNFPTTIARYFAAAFYIGFFLTYKPYFKWPFVFVLSFFICLIILFPIFSNFRYFSDFSDLNNLDLYSIVSSSYLGGDFDAYSMVCNTITYINNHDFKLCYQLIGSILFFIPRSIWIAKPMGSGYTVGESLGFDFLNISSPYIAESLINFSYFGVILFPLLYGILLFKLDSIFWISSKRNSSFIKLFYPCSLGLIFFMLRGDMLSSFAYLTGISFWSYIVFRISSKT